MMYAFVVMATISGVPQFFIMERGLTEAQCQDMSRQPDNGLRIDGKPVKGETRCVHEDELPNEDVPI